MRDEQIQHEPSEWALPGTTAAPAAPPVAEPRSDDWLSDDFAVAETGADPAVAPSRPADWALAGAPDVDVALRGGTPAALRPRRRIPKARAIANVLAVAVLGAAIVGGAIASSGGDDPSTDATPEFPVAAAPAGEPDDRALERRADRRAAAERRRERAADRRRAAAARKRRAARRRAAARRNAAGATGVATPAAVAVPRRTFVAPAAVVPQRRSTPQRSTPQRSTPQRSTPQRSTPQRSTPPPSTSSPAPSTGQVQSSKPSGEPGRQPSG